jgi:hypothetical protein
MPNFMGVPRLSAALLLGCGDFLAYGAAPQGRLPDE